MDHNEVLESPVGLPIYMRGPPSSEGPLPAFFYFALSGEESLNLDPYNQPVAFLKGSPIRCFSFTLPFHGNGYDNQHAIDLWEQEFSSHPQFLEVFFQNCLKNIDYLATHHLLLEDKMAIGGLSRGGFIAAHLAAKDARLKYILGFAPMTQFPRHQKESTLSLHQIVPSLANKQVRFYIGNRDLSVGTNACYHFIHQLTEISYHAGHRSPPIELIITPSVGYKGHGTLPPIFEAGTKWIKDKLTF